PALNTSDVPHRYPPSLRVSSFETQFRPSTLTWARLLPPHFRESSGELKERIARSENSTDVYGDLWRTYVATDDHRDRKAIVDFEYRREDSQHRARRLEPGRRLRGESHRGGVVYDERGFDLERALRGGRVAEPVKLLNANARRPYRAFVQLKICIQARDSSARRHIPDLIGPQRLRHILTEIDRRDEQVGCAELARPFQRGTLL